MNNTKSLAAALSLIMLVGAGCTNSASAPTPNTETAEPSAPAVSTTTTTSVAPTTATKPTTVKTPTTNKATAPATAQKYSEAVSKYGFDGARIQFISCSGQPNSLSIKVGVKFMLDNRDSVIRRIGIGKSTYVLEPYGFSIVTVQTAGSYIVTCNGGGAAQLLVQN